MFITRKTTRGIGLLALAGAMLLAACAPQEAPEPTQDPSVLYTAAAQTVQAEITMTAAALPSATPSPSPQPSATVGLPTLEGVGQGDTGVNVDVSVMTATTMATLSVPGTSSTQAPAAGVTSGDAAEWVSNDPADGSTVATGQKFDIRWTVRNTGTTTWNKNYMIRWYAGEKMAEKLSYNFREETAPDGTTTLIIDGLAPSSAGEYQTTWVLTNEQGQNFYSVYLELKVGKATSTPTP
jgi:hypothetical protein